MLESHTLHHSRYTPFSNTIVVVVGEDFGLRGNVQNDGESSLAFLSEIPLFEDSKSRDAVLEDDSIKLLTNLRLAELISLRLELLSSKATRVPLLFLRLLLLLL